MTRNRDFFVAIFFIALSVVLFVATFYLPEPMFDQLAASTWPRIILVPLVILSVILLIQSQGAVSDAAPLQSTIDWLLDNKRPWACFGLFFLFLLSMPYLGMLVGGLLYVFVTLCTLGGWSRRKLLLHAAISLVFVVGMWAIFTQLLGVLLPTGSLIKAL